VSASLEERLRNRGDARLTDREVQTALLVLAGHSTKGIANEMGISPETVKVHRRNVYDKLGVSTQAALFALFLPTVQTQTGMPDEQN
jgi:DNA-binding CsgD family transcriptional regulator